MILIADSGSTKTDWRRVESEGNISQAVTCGLNPMVVDNVSFDSGIHDGIPQEWFESEYNAIYFYGAGCRDESQQGQISGWLKALFSTMQIEVYSDVLGACRAVCSATPGIVCILGTGSNGCQYDGQKITKSIQPLGYLLGDEGSGNAIGKRFLKALLRGELPNQIEQEFKKIYKIDNLLTSIYRHPKTNEYLASFVPFVHDNKSEPMIMRMITNEFTKFIGLVIKLGGAQRQQVHFVGSVAFNFNEILSSVVREAGLSMGKIVASPISGLTLYHRTDRS